MILNGYAILLLLMNLIRLPLALFVAAAGFSALRATAGALQPERRKSLEARSYLLMISAIWLVGLNVLSWPLFYWLLQSYVPEWPDVMCIYGVTQIGRGSLGASRFLPGVLVAVQLLKPLLLFLSGSWFVIYWLNRQTEMAGLMRRVIAASLLVGLVSVADSSLEVSYIVTPKREDLPSVGCCTMPVASRSSAVPATGWFSEGSGEWLPPAYYGINSLMIAALVGHLSFPRMNATKFWRGPLVAGMLAAVTVSYLFLVQIVAPRILHLPHHHCAYDLVSLAPESVVGIALFVFGSLAIGWACVAVWAGQRIANSSFVQEMRDRVLFLALFGYLSSLVLFSVELAVSA